MQQFSDDLDTSSSLPMLNTSCESEEEELGCGGVLNDSGSDSGISNPCTSTWKRVGGGGLPMGARDGDRSEGRWKSTPQSETGARTIEST